MLRPYDGYKETNIQWLGRVPNHWETKKINELFKERKSKVSDKDFAPLSVTKKGIVPQLSNAAKSNDSDNRKLVCEGDFVINSRSDRKGSSGISPLTGSVSLINIALEPRKQNNSKFMHHLLKSNSFIEEYYRNGRGIVADLWTTRYSEMKTIILPVPPREEQNQIVKYLDWQTSKINTFIKAKKKQIELLKEQKQAVINKAVTKGLDDTVPMKDSGIEWLGEVPMHWDSRFLFQIAKEQGISNKGMISDNLLSLSYGRIINKNINKTDGLLPMSFETYQIVDNGNIILRLTDLQNDHKSLRVGLVTQKGIITSAYTCLNPQKNVLADFLYNLLHSYDVCKVFYGMGGGVRQSIGYKDISKIICFCPPLEEQQAIVTYLEEKTELIDKAIAVIEKEIELVSEYKTSLISSVVTGKLDVRDVVVPDFEVVEEEIPEDDDGLEVDVDDSN